MSPETHRISRSTLAEQLSQYDLLLMAIPVVLAAGIAGGLFLAVPLFVGSMAGATGAATLACYGVYLITQRQSTD